MADFKTERTLVVVKPDGIQRSLVGDIISRYERMGLKLVGLKVMRAEPDFIERHYTLDPGWKRKVGEKAIESYQKKGQTPPSSDPMEVGDAVVGRLKSYMASGPVIAMVWEGAHVVEIVRKITGGTEPRSSDVGTIRGDYMLDSYAMADTDNRAIRNLIHASGSVEEANGEIALWFRPEELVQYRHVQEEILYKTDIASFLN